MKREICCTPHFISSCTAEKIRIHIEEVIVYPEPSQADKDNSQIKKDALQNQSSLLNVTHQKHVSAQSCRSSEYNSYVANHQYTSPEYNEAFFSSYYVKPAEQKFGVHNLEDELYGLEWLHPCQEGVFDCSEMTAYLGWHLENEGWNAIIIAGDSPSDSEKHARAITKVTGYSAKGNRRRNTVALARVVQNT